MLASHILDNNKKTNLKYKIYTLFGISGYDSKVDEYLKATKEEEESYGANAFNRIEEIDIKDLLEYGGMDSLGTYKLWEYQNSMMTDNMKIAQELSIKGSLALAKA